MNNSKLSVMERQIFIAFVVIGLLMCSHDARGQEISSCTYNSNDCSCETNKGKIQLRSPATPYQAPDTNLPYIYFWDPCKDFDLGTTTAGAIQQDMVNFNLEIGVHSMAFSSVVNGYAVFSMNSIDLTRTTNVKCICGDGDTFHYDSEIPRYTYNFNFQSPDCCPSNNSQGGDGISVGTVMLIIFCALAVVYFLLGTLYQVVARKAKGRERIPNNNLWTALPGLVKDGVLFTFKRRRLGYSKI